MPANTSMIRRSNLLTLFKVYAEQMIAEGSQPKGLDQSFAALIEVGESTLSMAKSGSRPIGNKLARQIEHRCGKPAGWLDEQHEEAGLTSAEQSFLAMALNAYRRANSDGRRRLRALMKE